MYIGSSLLGPIFFIPGACRRVLTSFSKNGKITKERFYSHINNIFKKFMFDILFARTFFIVGGMLLVTALTAHINKVFETAKEAWATIIGTFVFLFAITFFADIFPLNLFLVAFFSGIMGWLIGPTIDYFGRYYKLKKFLKSRGLVFKKGDPRAKELKKEIGEVIMQFKKVDPGAEESRNEFTKMIMEFKDTQYTSEWHTIVFQAMMATAFAVFATAGIVFLTKFDFSFLGGFLLIALFILVIMGFVNLFFFHSRIFSLIRAYIGVVIFTLYLLFDFNRLEKIAGDKSWSAAIDIAVNIYLDIINLFLDLLEILSDASD